VNGIYHHAVDLRTGTIEWTNSSAHYRPFGGMKVEDGVLTVSGYPNGGRYDVETGAAVPAKPAAPASPKENAEKSFLRPSFPGVSDVAFHLVRDDATPRDAFVSTSRGEILYYRESPPAKPAILCEKAANDRDFSINDLAVSSRGVVYFTTLKDPEKGRLSAFDPRTGKVTVLFDGEQEEKLCNPNGIALDAAERFLFVGVSSYKNPGRAGVYCFPIRPDGTIDLEKGGQTAWVPVKADGIALRHNGEVFLTTEGKVEGFDIHGRSRGHVTVPKGTGTNLCFGPPNSPLADTLFFTTWDSLYSVSVK